MTTETWDPNATASSSADISMTDAAIKHFSKQLKKQTDAKGIRLWLKKSGCSGFKYELNFIDQIPEGEQSITINEDITLYVPKDRKSTRLNSSHVRISYAVFCLKKK